MVCNPVGIAGVFIHKMTEETNDLEDRLINRLIELDGTDEKDNKEDNKNQMEEKQPKFHTDE